MSETKKPVDQHTVGVKISERVHQGAYSNQMVVAHSREEFVLDFLVTFPPGAQVVARVVTSPGHVKRIVGALQDNLDQYEQKYGEVTPSTPKDLPPIDPSQIN